MKQITKKEFEEWQKYKTEKASGSVLLLDSVLEGQNGQSVQLC